MSCYEREKDRRRARMDEGLCFRCGKLPVPGEKQCEYCSDKHKERQARYRAKRRGRT